MRLALYQPDIPQNAGTLIRLGAGLGVPVDIIEPAGFPVSDRAFKRAGMDYIDHAQVARHLSYAAFNSLRREQGKRMVLLTTRGSVCYTDFVFRADDILMVGRESAGVPDEVHKDADGRVIIPLLPVARSLNVAIAAAIVLGEALRQTGRLPEFG
jgi:tRNA (cytidine/uridine-2'-O-)-methyltransferase